MKSGTPKSLGMRLLWDEAGMVVVLIALFVGCCLFVPNFANMRNMAGLGLAVSMTGMVACTMLFCLASGDFDLSIGSVVACAGVLAAVVVNKTGSVFLGITSGLAFGALVGLVNGLVIARLKINALITTLAMMQIVRGVAFIFAPGGVSVSVMDERFFLLGNTRLMGVPTPVWITVLCFILFGLLLQYTIFGRNTLAIGGNEEAARLAGIPVDRIKIVIFVLQGAMAAFAGIVMASRMTSGQPNVGLGFELAVISACVLGGVSLTGGVGNIWFVVSGVLIMGIVQNAMNLMNVPTFYQYVVSGSILLAAVILDRLKQAR
jgi:L-arabinose transport system permease protein